MLVILKKEATAGRSWVSLFCSPLKRGRHVVWRSIETQQKYNTIYKGTFYSVNSMASSAIDILLLLWALIGFAVTIYIMEMDIYSQEALGLTVAFIVSGLAAKFFVFPIVDIKVLKKQKRL